MAVDYMQRASKDGLTVVAYRGEDMILLAFDIDDTLKKPDFVGFGIQYRFGSDPNLRDVYNFLTFKALREKDEAENPPAKPEKKKAKPKKGAPAPAPAAPAKPVDFSFKASIRSPLQMFRWAHVPSVPINGPVTYVVSAMFWAGADKPPVAKATCELTIDVSSDTRPGFLNVGFTRGFASSQAYVRRFQNTPDVLQKKGKHELDLDPTPFAGPDGPYPWLGFEARKIMLGFLDELINDPNPDTISVDCYAYDFSNPEIVHRLEKLGNRLRIVIDNSGTHGRATSEETRAAKLLTKSKASVKRHKFQGLQHNKIFIGKRNGKPFAVLTGSTNFALRGLYIQNNNVLLFRDEEIAGWYERVFEAGFPSGDGFKKNDVAKDWFPKTTPNGNYAFCYSPHADATLSMKRIADSVEAAESSVMYAIAFYGAQTGLAGEAIRAIDTDKIQVMGVADKPGSAKPKRPAKGKKAKAKPKKDLKTTFVQLPGRGRVPLSPAALAKDLPPPFHAEWPGGSGVRMHHKFVICDFNGKKPVAYTGSSNLATGGEQGNGDNLIEIRDPKVVVAYAVQAVSIFDHYAFRVRMKGVKKKPEAMDLAEPPAAGEKPWWDAAFGGDPGKTNDRKLFAAAQV